MVKRKSSKRRSSKRRKSSRRSRSRKTNKARRRKPSVAKKGKRSSKRSLIGGTVKNGLAGIAAGEITEMGANAVVGNPTIGLAAGAGASYLVGKGPGILGYVAKKVITGGLNLGGLNLGSGGGAL